MPCRGAGTSPAAGPVGWPSPAVGPEQAVDDRAEMAGGHRVEGSGAGQLPELRGGAEVTSGTLPDRA